MLDLNAYKAELIRLCNTLSVKRLSLVGSAARDDFSSESSDIDVLIELDGSHNLFDRYFDLKFGLENIFGRKVDVIQDDAVKNPHMRASLEEDRMLVYET